MMVTNGREITITRSTGVKGKPVEPGDVLTVGKDLDVADARSLLSYKHAELVALPEKVEPPPKEETAEERKANILEATRMVLESGENLTQGGKPEVKAVEAILGYDITAAERDEAMEVLEAEERTAEILEAMKTVTEEGERLTDAGSPEAEAVAELLDYEVTQEEIEEITKAMGEKDDTP